MIQIPLNHALVLALANKAQHGRALATTLQASQSTISRTLNILKDDFIVDYESQGKNKVYRLKNNQEARHALAAAEHVKAATFLKNNRKEAALLQEVLKRTSATMVVLFGSYAINKQHKDSDIDLYMNIGREERDALGELRDALRIQPGTFDSSTALAQEVIKKHVILKGVDEFLALTRPEKQRKAATRKPFGYRER
jgi:predicted nucleotidyltransferase